MNTEDTEPNLFNNRRFIASSVVVALIVMLGVVIGVTNTVRDNPETSTSPPKDATSQPTESGEASICSLGGEVLTGSLWKAPRAAWDYQGTTAYPTSKTYGPAKTTPQGVRYCFQHSPAGALFAAASGVAQGTDSDAETVRSWVDYFIAEGTHRDALLAQSEGSSSGNEGIRIKIEGFRMLTYDGETARVDIGVSGSTEGRTVNMSAVYDLIWQDGDWKLNTSNAATPVDMASVPDLVGYIPWGE